MYDFDLELRKKFLTTMFSYGTMDSYLFYQTFVSKLTIDDVTRSVHGDEQSYEHDPLLSILDQYMGDLERPLIDWTGGVNQDFINEVNNESHKWQQKIHPNLRRKMAAVYHVSSEFGEPVADYFHKHMATAPIDALLAYYPSVVEWIALGINQNIEMYDNIVSGHDSNIITHDEYDGAVVVQGNEGFGYLIGYVVNINNGTNIVVDIKKSIEHGRNVLDLDVDEFLEPVATYEFTVPDFLKALPFFMIDIIRDEVKDNLRFVEYE